MQWIEFMGVVQQHLFQYPFQHQTLLCTYFKHFYFPYDGDGDGAHVAVLPLTE
jgi:hypothetical protein